MDWSFGFKYIILPTFNSMGFPTFTADHKPKFAFKLSDDLSSACNSLKSNICLGVLRPENP